MRRRRDGSLGTAISPAPRLGSGQAGLATAKRRKTVPGHDGPRGSPGRPTSAARPCRIRLFVGSRGAGKAGAWPAGGARRAPSSAWPLVRCGAGYSQRVRSSTGSTCRPHSDEVTPRTEDISAPSWLSVEDALAVVPADLRAGLQWFPPFRPQLVHGWAVAGICLIRLGRLRPSRVPSAVGLRSENAAHRIAVEWDIAADPGLRRGGPQVRRAPCRRSTRTPQTTSEPRRPRGPRRARRSRFDREVSRRSTRRVRADRVGSCSRSRCGSRSRGADRMTDGPLPLAG